MGAARDDLKRLRGAIVATALMLALAAGAAWQARMRHQELVAARVAAMRADAQARSLRAELSARQLQVRTYGERFAALVREGVVGEFGKTQAVDRFEALARRGPGDVRGYRLEGRIAAGDLVGAGGLETLELVRQGLSFDAQPLHEEAFVRALARIGDGVGGLATIESCEMSRAAEGASAASDGATRADGAAAPARLSARCNLAWYSFVTAGKAVEPPGPVAPAVPPAPGGVRR